MVTVGNLMQKEPVMVDAGTSVVEAAKLMKACNVESVLVARQAQIIGMVTESDVVKKFVGAEKVSYFVPVEEIMSSPRARYRGATAIDGSRRPHGQTSHAPPRRDQRGRTHRPGVGSGLSPTGVHRRVLGSLELHQSAASLERQQDRQP